MTVIIIGLNLMAVPDPRNTKQSYVSAVIHSNIVDPFAHKPLILKTFTLFTPDVGSLRAETILKPQGVCPAGDDDNHCSHSYRIPSQEI